MQNTPKKQRRGAAKAVATALFLWYIVAVKQQIYRVNYGTSSRNVQLIIDEAFAERIIPADDSVRLLDQIVEEMDLTPLMRAYKRTGRRPANTPVNILKIMLYASMENIYSSRSIVRLPKDKFTGP